MVLRPYGEGDAATIISWIENEFSFRQWCADRYGGYPITPADMNALYDKMRKTVKFYPFTAVDENEKPVGHFIIRYTDEERKIVRIGFVIVDNARRGAGLGKEMMKKALEYAFGVLGAKKVTLGVFENNARAEKCYRSVGFDEIASEVTERYEVFGEEWKMKLLGTDRK